MAYPIKTWAILRAAYESGDYGSVEEMCKCSKIAKKLGKMPSLKSIQLQSEKEGWKKASLKPIIEKTIREKKIEYAAEIGFDPIRSTITTLNDMHKATKPCIITGYGKKGEESDGPQGFATEIEDWSARANAVKLTSEIFGLKEAENLDITSGGDKIAPTRIMVELLPTKKD